MGVSRSQEDTAAAIIEAERPGVLEPSEGASTSYSSRARDTGIQLAAADTSTDRWTEYQNEKRRAMEKYATEKQKRRIFGKHSSKQTCALRCPSSNQA